MGLKSFLSKPFASFVASRIKKWSKNPFQTQDNVFRALINTASNTQFGKEHQFADIHNYDDFKRLVPIREYEDFKPYIEKIKKGEPNISWPGKPLYLSKTSGTTSGVKYIPITKDSIPFHINAARDSLLMYIHETGNSDFTDRKMIFFSGSPELDMSEPIPTGRLSGIVNHYVPGYLRTNQLPSYETNCIEDWENKIEKIVEETRSADMSLLSGIPPWVQMYLDKLKEETGKSATELFPNLSLFVYGGVNYEPYRAKMEKSLGRKLDSIELYPASEGFIAFQDTQKEKGLLLLLNSGMFYEFIPAQEYSKPNATRLRLQEVEVGVNYAIVLNTNAGLWGYSIGDTIKFLSKDPYRLIVTGRVKHFLSAFGEHVIGEEVEKAMLSTLEKMHAEVIEFTVAPQINPKEGLPYHEWFVEFGKPPEDLELFRMELDAKLQELNIYYKDLIKGNIIQPLKMSIISKDGFINYMRSVGKLGGQNKVPRLSNDRKIAEELLILIAK